MTTLKAGDWVRDTRSGIKNPITQLKPNCVALTNPKEDGKHFVPWRPYTDEVCWFYDYLDFTPTVGTFVIMDGDNFLADIPNGKGSLILTSFNHCAPFIGTLPEYYIK